ncbi:MAG TPA: c-type cytochrome [Gemmatimonadales bacterium]|nr:c-type cytochrome [Gemmatimonadales bacterium]
MRWCGSDLAPVALALGLALAAAPMPCAAQASADSTAGVSDQVYTGWKYFQVYCSRCHGDDALGTMAAPDLTYSLTEEGGVTADSFRVIVREGSSSPSAAPDQQMRGFGDLLEPVLIDALYSYVRARSDGSLGPGRPRRASAAP